MGHAQETLAFPASAPRASSLRLRQARRPGPSRPVNVRLDTETRERLELACAASGRRLSDEVRHALALWSRDRSAAVSVPSQTAPPVSLFVVERRPEEDPPAALSVRLDQEVRRLLERLAREQERTLSWVIRQALRDHLRLGPAPSRLREVGHDERGGAPMVRG